MSDLEGQLSIDDAPRVRPTDPATSHNAAAAQTPTRLSAGRVKILVALASDGPQADFELELRVRMPRSGTSTRRLECQRAGWVEATGDTRVTPYGQAANVYRLTDSGWEALSELVKSEAVLAAQIRRR